LHGWMGDYSVFRPMFDFLDTDTFTYAFVDYRGYGQSKDLAGDYTMAEISADAIALADHLGWQQFHLIGHSMGGMVGIVTAAEFPEEVGTLVVIDSMMRMSEERAAELRGIGAGKGKGFDSKDAYVAGFRIHPETTSARPEVTRHMAASSCRQFEDGQWRNKFDRNVYARRHPIDGYAYWTKVWDAKIPALVIAGGNSNRIAPEVRAKLFAAHPEVTVTTVENAGHHVTLDNPAGYIDALATYLQSNR